VATRPDQPCVGPHGLFLPRPLWLSLCVSLSLALTRTHTHTLSTHMPPRGPGCVQVRADAALAGRGGAWRPRCLPPDRAAHCDSRPARYAHAHARAHAAVAAAAAAVAAAIADAVGPRAGMRAAG
jgi:hypothetical protein